MHLIIGTKFLEDLWDKSDKKICYVYMGRKNYYSSKVRHDIH